MVETAKAKKRRESEDFFKKYCRGLGLDIGCGDDLISTKDFKLKTLPFDGMFGHGDATFLNGVPDNHFDYVHASHILEHIKDIETCIKNWWRVLKTGGYLLILVPERELYEKKKELPSKWNDDHQHFFLLCEDEEPDTIGIAPLLSKIISKLAKGINYRFLSARTLQESVTEPTEHSSGEYSIELVIKKLQP